MSLKLETLTNNYEIFVDYFPFMTFYKYNLCILGIGFYELWFLTSNAQKNICVQEINTHIGILYD